MYAVKLAWTEFKQRWVLIIGTIAVAWLIGHLLGRSNSHALVYGLHSEGVLYNGFMTDLIILLILPNLSVLFAGKEYWSWSTLASEPFLTRMRFYRMWPMPLEAIVWSRVIFMLICLLLGMTSFIAAFTYGGWTTFAEVWSPGAYCTYLMFLTGYALAMSGGNVYMEFAISAKLVFMSWLVSILIGGLAVSVLHVAFDQPMYIGLMDMAGRYPLWSGFIALLLGAAGLYLFKRALLRRLRRMDLP